MNKGYPREIDALLNAPSADERLENLKKIRIRLDRGEFSPRPKGIFVNNHIHTKFSFSPYSPALAVFKGYMEGLDTVGIIDHDTFAGAEEFTEAGKILGIRTSRGMELRVDYAGTPLEGKIINNPDQKSVAYKLLHGVPLRSSARMKALSGRIIPARMARNQAMTENLNRIFAPWKIFLDFEREVVGRSYYAQGGTVTERHLLDALAGKLIERFGGISAASAFLSERFGLPPLKRGQNRAALLGALKAGFVAEFYEEAGRELIPVREAVALGREAGGLSCYSYLGGVKECVTGDKRAQPFEDAFLPLLFEVIRALGIRSVTYAPSRNSDEQLRRFQALCAQYDLFELSGEDINSPDQPLICPRLAEPAFARLLADNEVLLCHERAAEGDPALGFESPAMLKRFPGTAERAEWFLSRYGTP